MTRATLVAFDWNGTVVDDSRRAVDATNELLRRSGRPPMDHAAFLGCFTLPLDDWLTRIGLPGSSEEWNAAMSRRPAPLRHGTVDAFIELRRLGAQLAVVSAANNLAIGADLDRLNLRTDFDYIATSVTDKAGHLSELAGTHELVVYVGDTEFDVRSAQAAGCPSIALLGGWQSSDRLRRAGATVVLDGIRDVPGCLRSLRGEN